MGSTFWNLDLVLLLRKPSRSTVDCFLQAQSRLAVTYPMVGATVQLTEPPPNYVLDHTRIKVGAGEDAFRAGRVSLESWQQFRLGWVEAIYADTEIKAGGVVAVLASTFGVWWLNACRIVYVFDEPSPRRRFGFAYGTLPGHAESGEERFSIEWNQLDDSVWYDILAFSRPRHLLARLGYPLVRRMQKRFARESASAMRSAVALALSGVPAKKVPGGKPWH